MAKVALLIGVSEYESGFSPLPAAPKDVEAMKRVLKHPEIGGFDAVEQLINPDPVKMQEAIETLFSGRTKDDLVLLFFSGHGVKDDSGRLYFTTRITRKNAKGELVQATTTPASFVHGKMSSSRSRRQVVILDCCFSGAFAEGLSAKDDGSVDIKSQLGGEGRAVLTSSTSTQYSFEQQGAALSTYTHYLVEGIGTGAADLDGNGMICVDELHEYAKGKVQQAAPAMKPEFYPVKEGHKIYLAKALVDDPKLRYRKEVEHCASRGEISIVSRSTLDFLRDSLGLLPEDAASIEAEVLKPYQEYKQKLQRYEQALVDSTQREHRLSDYTRNELKRFQQVLGLRDQDVAPIEARVAPQFVSKHLVPKFGVALLILGVAICGYSIITQLWTFPLSSVVPDQPSETPESTSNPPSSKNKIECPKPNVALGDVLPQGDKGTVFCWTKSSYDPRIFKSVQDKNCRRTGSHGLRLKYNFTGEDNGGWGVFFIDTATQHFDASKFSSLVFWIKGESGGDKFEVGLKDTHGKDKEGKEGKVQSERMVVVSATEWKRVTVPLSSFINDKGEIVDNSSINNVNFGFNSNHGSGSICIDDIAFE